MSPRNILVIYFVLLNFCNTFPQNRVNDSLSNKNHIVILDTGKAKFDDLFHAVKLAKRSIHMEYFNFRNDSISHALFDLLKNKCKDGVEVRVLFDAFGNASNNRPLRKKNLDSLRQMGIEIFKYDPIKFPYFNHISPRDHRKIVVIDGDLAYIGGMNVADYYISGKPKIGKWRDLHTRVQGAVVSDLQTAFLKTWNKQTGQSVSGCQYYPDRTVNDFKTLKSTKDNYTCDSVLVVNRGPGDSRRIFHDTFITLINQAKDSINIINPYFTLCSHVKRALKHVIKKGVKVRLLVSNNSDIPITPRVVDHNAHLLMKWGAKVYYYEGGFHHSKIMLIDNLYSFLGSANLDSRSLLKDYECNLFIVSHSVNNQLNLLFEKEINHSCWTLTPNTWKTKFPLKRRFAAWFWTWLTPFI